MNQGTGNQANLGLLNWIRENWVWAAPLIYIYVTVVGMVQAWLQFNAFDINVFEFSEINDFLLAAFREPLSFLAILGVIAYGGIGLLSQWIFFLRFKTNQTPERVARRRRIYKLVMYPTFVFLVLIAPYSGPVTLHEGYGEKWKEQFLSEPTRHVEALIKDLEKYGTEKGWIQNLTLLGTTDKFVFFYDRLKKEILVVPVSNILIIKRIEMSNITNAADARTSRD